MHEVEKTVSKHGNAYGHSLSTRLVLDVFVTYFGPPKLNSVKLDTYHHHYLTIEITESLL